MSLPIHLQKIKSSGVYRFVYDKSVISGETAETLRLLVGYSDKGPFNTPVYIETREDFIKTYGNISKRLEKKGVFFHRLALQALASGPILCLNLKPFDNTNKVQWSAFDASTAITDLGADTLPEDNTVIETFDTNRFWTLNADDLTDPIKYGTDKYVVFTATDSVDTSCSIIVRPVRPDEYALSIREFYGTAEMPDYLKPIQDEMLNNFFADVYVFRGKFTPELCGVGGPLARYFNVSKDGDKDIITLEENYTDAFGEPADVLTALAGDEASGYITGYRGTSIPYFKNANGSYISLDLLFNSGYSEHKMLMKLKDSDLDQGLSEDDATYKSRLLKLLKFTVLGEDAEPFNYYDRADVCGYNKISELPSGVTATTVAEVPSSVSSNSPEYIQISGSDPVEYYKREIVSYTYTANPEPTDEVKAAATLVENVPTDVTADSPEHIKVARVDDIHYYKRGTADPTTGLYPYVEVTSTDSDYKKAVKNAVEVNADDVTVGGTAVNDDLGLYIKITTVSTPSISPFYLSGFTYDNSNINADACLNVIIGDYGKGLQEALTNRVDVEYHYLVDTFDTATYNNKTVLSALARKKDNCFAILNFPKIKDFKSDPTNFTRNTLDFKKVCAKFIMPDDADGASWVGFFTQVVLSDGTIRSTIPSAGLVSNLFMDKWSSRQPYYIVAGSQFGRLLDGTLVGPDYAFSKTDRDVLEPFGINVIVYEPRRGTYINSEQTAKQIPVSALSKIHIRELVIYLQDEIAELLESYRWELNTQTLRDKIKAKADVILETVKNNGGVYDYLNVCDDSNNTPETIDNEFLVLDTHIEPARGAGKMVEQLFIYRTGEMRSTLLQG